MYDIKKIKQSGGVIKDVLWYVKIVVREYIVRKNESGRRKKGLNREI